LPSGRGRGGMDFSMEKCHVSHWSANVAMLLAEKTIQGVLLVDGAYRIVCGNARAAVLLGAKDVDAMAGLSIHSSDATSGIYLAEPFLSPEGAGPRSGRYTLSTEFGAELPVDLQFFPVPGAAEETSAARYLVLVTDMSPRIELERSTLQAERLEAMDNIVAGIAHELNNPMTAIMGYAELLLATEKDPKRKQRIALIAEEADRCGKIIGNMLTYTRSYGKTLESANINDVLEEVMRLQTRFPGACC
jgi:nitrogen-specific signal transduction histidine kinase